MYIAFYTCIICLHASDASLASLEQYEDNVYTQTLPLELLFSEDSV